MAPASTVVKAMDRGLGQCSATGKWGLSSLVLEEEGVVFGGIAAHLACGWASPLSWIPDLDVGVEALAM